MMLKLIFILCLLCFASSTDIKSDVKVNTPIQNPQHTPPTWFANLHQDEKDNMVALLVRALNQYGGFGKDVRQNLIAIFQINDFQAEQLYKFVYHTALQNHDHTLSQNLQEDETAYLYDSQEEHIPEKQFITDNIFNQKQTIKKKKKPNLFLCCFKFKSKENKSQTKDEPETLTKKIKVKSTDNFDKIRNMKSPLTMPRKSSAPTHRVTIPIELSRRFSGESVKSAIILSRKPSGESVRSARLISRKSSAESVNSPIQLTRTLSDECIKPPTNFGKRYTQRWKSFLGNPMSFINKPSTEKENVQETPVEETSEPKDIRSYSCKNVLLYVCLDENVENCQKCKKLKHIFESQNSEQNYLLYNLPIQKLQNPTKLDLQNIPTWLELMLWSMVTEKQDMKLYITLNLENDGEANYQSKSTYAELLRKNARVSPLGGHIFFSVLKSNFLTEDLNFFLENNILKPEDTFVNIGESEGMKVIDGEKYVNTFLFNGVMEEDIIDYTPTVGNMITSRNNLTAYYEDQEEPEEIVKGTLLTVEEIDPNDSWILLSYVDTKEKKTSMDEPRRFQVCY